MGESHHRPNARVFDMFCSIGGLTYGLQQAGLAVSAGLDSDGSCQYAYGENCQAAFLEADIREISYADVAPYLDDAEYRVLVGCAPCQPFSSHTVKMKAYQSDERWNLIGEFLRIILEGRPEIVSMENVPQLMKKPIYQSFKHRLVEAGYQVSDGVLSCDLFGVPQSRSRLVMLASLLGQIGMPKPESQRTSAKCTGVKRKGVKCRGVKFYAPTVRRAIGHLEHLESGRASEGDPLHVCSRLAPINLQRIRASKPGGSWRDWPGELLPDCYKKASGSTYGSVYGRMQWDKPAPTLTTQFYRYGTGRYGHPEQDRALSLREGAILQTFPEEYRFIAPGEQASFSKIGRQIGNAVPPSLGVAIGKAMIDHLNKRSKNV